MKATTKILSVLFLSVAVILVSAGIAMAYPTGWTSDNTVVPSNAWTCDICSRGSDVWLAYRDTDGIKVKHSINKAVTWTAQVTVETANSDSPQITITTTGTLFLAYWTDAGIRVKTSADDGSTWTDYASVANATIANFSMTHSADNPALAWEQTSNPGTGNPYHDSYYSLLGAGGTLTGTRASHSDNENSNENPSIATDGNGSYFVVYQTTDYVDEEDSGIWVTRVNGSTTYDQIYNGQYAFYGYPSVAFQGSGVFAVNYVVSNSNNVVYRRQWNGSSWSGSMNLYNAGSTNPFVKTLPFDGGDCLARASNSSDVVLATADTDPVVLQGVNAVATSRSLAACADSTDGAHYAAGVTTSGSILVKRTDGTAPVCSGVTVTGNTVGDTTYCRANFTASFAGVVDDWNTTGTDPLGDAYTNGVSRVAVKYADSPSAVVWGDLPPATGVNPIENAPWQLTTDISGLSDGNWYIKGVMTDTAANTADSPVYHVVIDTTPPTATATVNTSTFSGDWRNRPTHVTITGSDIYLDHCEYRFDSGSWTRYTAPILVPDGRHDVQYRAVDLAGNYSIVGHEYVNVDTVAPSPTFTYPLGDTVEADRDNRVWLMTSSTDATSGVVWSAIYIDGSKREEIDSSNVGHKWDVANVPEGLHTLKVEARDAAGNIGSMTKRVNLLKADSLYSDFYFAEGTTRQGFDEYLCVLNPDAKNNAALTFTFQLETGQTITKTATVAANSRATFHVPDMVPAGHDVSTKIHSEGAYVVAERPMYFNYKGVWTGGHTAVGRNVLQQDYYFAEGTTRPGFDEWITLQNPNGSAATATVTYMLGSGQNINKSYTVPANTRVTVNVNADIGPGQDVSAKVHSNVPIAAERPMYFSYNGTITGGHLVTGATAPQKTWYFAEGTTREGFNEYLCLQNPGGDNADVTVNYSTGQSKTYPVGPHSRYTVNVNAEVGNGKDVSATVTSDSAIVAERPMYFNYNGITGGHDTMGANEPGCDFYFAEGTTRDGFNEFITVLTPSVSGNAGNGVVLFYQFPDGKTVTKSHFLVGSRGTINVNEDIGPNKDVSIRIVADPTTGTRFVVERPMYFNYRGWTGGSDVTGYSPY